VSSSAPSRWPPWADPLIAAAIVAVGVVELVPGDAPAGQVAAASVMGAVLAWRRRAPLLVLSVVSGAFLAQQLAGYELNYVYTPFALMIAYYAVGAHCETPRAAAGLGAGLALQALGIAIEDLPLSDILFPGVIVTLPWLAGAALRVRIRAALTADTRARRAEDEREQHAAAAVAEERSRIARELHDLVAHSVSVMVMQAGVLRRRLPDDDRSRDLAQTIERTGREALVEMRRMLGLLRDGASEDVPLAPLPGLARLNDLVESTRTAGVPVELSVDAAPGPLPPGLDLCAYRIVQESLTNVIKHAGRASARVSVRFPPGSVELEVVDDGPGGAITAHGGHGLVGMRERAALFGGQVEAGPGRTGGFAVHALLPLEAR
jgi:signal transduction histidine kinase